MAGTYAKYFGGQSSGGGGGSGGIASINGDTTSAQVITGGTGISVSTASGTTTITNTGSGGNVTGPGSSVANTLPTFADATGKLLQDTQLVLTTPGTRNVFLNQAGNTTLTGNHNFAIGGTSTAPGLTTGSANIFFGSSSGGAATTYSGAVAIGQDTLGSLATGNNDIAIGLNALNTLSSETGNPIIALGNIGVGFGSFTTMTNGDGNVGVGVGVGYGGTTGFYNNSYLGQYAGGGTASSSIDNAAVGAFALANSGVATVGGNTYFTGTQNAALGALALGGLGTAGGSSAIANNAAVGYKAGFTNASYTQSTLIGSLADTASTGLTNATAIGYGAIAPLSNTIQLGNSSVVGLYYPGYTDLTQQTTPASPATGHDRLYFKSDDNLYKLNSSGIETQLTGNTGTVTSVTFTGDGTILSATPSSAVTTSGTLTATRANFNAYTTLANNTGSSAVPIQVPGPLLGWTTLTSNTVLTINSPSYNVLSTTSTTISATLPAASTCGGKVFYFYPSSNLHAGSVILNAADTYQNVAAGGTIALSGSANSAASVLGLFSGGSDNKWYPVYPNLIMGTQMIISGALAGSVIAGNSSGNPTAVGAGTSGQYLISAGASAPTWHSLVGATKQVFTSGTGATYTTPAGVLYLKIRVMGGGGGGQGSGTSPGAGTVGNASSFSTVTANGGAAGGSGGGGGTATGGSVINMTGSNGGGASGVNGYGGQGGDGVLGGSSAGGTNGSGAGGAGATNSGSGGGGGGGAATVQGAVGGGAGGYAEHIIVSPGATFTYTVGATAAGGIAGAGGGAGGTGAAGLIIVEEMYQ